MTKYIGNAFSLGMVPRHLLSFVRLTPCDRPDTVGLVSCVGHADTAGAQNLLDPVAALVFCSPIKADYTVVGGKYVVKAGHMATLDVRKQVEEHNRLARSLFDQ